MTPRHPIDPEDPFGSRPDEKPPEGWPDGWDDRFWDGVCREIEQRRDEPEAGSVPERPRPRNRAVHITMTLILAAALVAILEDLHHGPSRASGEPGRTVVHVDGSRAPDVAVEWARIGGNRSGYVVLRSIDPDVSYVLIDPRLTAE